MPRSIRLGDKVQAFWDANISGTVVEIYKKKAGVQMTEIGPTQVKLLYCKVKTFKTGNLVEVKLSDIFITEH